jgi:hypothetical protein
MCLYRGLKSAAQGAMRCRLGLRPNLPMSVIRIAAVLLMPLVSAAATQSTATSDAKSESAGSRAPVDTKGNPRVPNDRLAYEFLGSWAVAADKEPGSQQIHTVYASPGSVAAFRKNGRFPDGTVLVKEVFQAATDQMTTGTVSHAQTLRGWFVMIRDGEDTHPGNKLWGDGWGWSWFDADTPDRTATVDYRMECQGCHIPSPGL